MSTYKQSKIKEEKVKIYMNMSGQFFQETYFRVEINEIENTKKPNKINRI